MVFFFISKTVFGTLLDTIGTKYYEEAHRRIIKKLEVDGGNYK